MSLWQLMHLICIGLTLGAANAAAKVAKSGVGATVVATAIGLAVGIGFAWAMWTSGRILTARIRKLPEELHEQRFRLMYFGAFVWIALGGLASGLISHFVLGLAF
jgi:hypothetical protein